MKGRQTILDLLLSVAKIVALVVLVFYLIEQTKGMYDLGYSIFAPTPRDLPGHGKTVEVTITSDLSPLKIGGILEDKDLIESKYVFLVQERFSPHHGELTAGTYELSSEMLPEEMMEIMSANHVDESSKENS